ncbi:MAG: hypothetical protein K1X57_03060 [Gemmataceae bacterium]|nr:hypothetical protein [Gemmataceae bacterium]
MNVAALVLVGGGRRSLRSVVPLLVIVGLVLVGVSAAPLPYWLYAVVGAATLCWVVAEASRRNCWLGGSARGWRLATMLAWAMALSWELPYQMMPRLPRTGRPTLCVIGDSVIAGMGERERRTWPVLLAEQKKIAIADVSQMGATVASASRQADQLPNNGELILLEIGGNDVLGSSTTVEYRDGLERLLKKVCRPDRTVVMFELPLPPLANEFGLIQRELAGRFGVHLIPKRVFIGVLTTAGATHDSVHLTPAGHQRMADVVWSVMGSGFE